MIALVGGQWGGGCISLVFFVLFCFALFIHSILSSFVLSFVSCFSICVCMSLFLHWETHSRECFVFPLSLYFIALYLAQVTILHCQGIIVNASCYCSLYLALSEQLNFKFNFQLCFKWTASSMPKQLDDNNKNKNIIFLTFKKRAVLLHH